MTKKDKTFGKYLFGIGAGCILAGAVVGGIVSCSNGSNTTTTTSNTTTNNSAPTTTNTYALEKGASQPGLQYTSNAISKDTNLVATTNPIKNQPGDLDVYAGNGLSAIITPSEIASGETINLTLNLAPGVNAPSYNDLMKLPSLIAIQPYQSTSSYTITQGKTLDMSLNANSSFDVNFKALPSNGKNEILGSNDTTLETSTGQFGIYLLANNNDNDPIEFGTGLTDGGPSVVIGSINHVPNSNQGMASADLTLAINGKSVPIDLTANLQSYFSVEKANDTTDFINLFYDKDGKPNGSNVNIGTNLSPGFGTDDYTLYVLSELGDQPGFHKVSPFTIITQTPDTSNQFTILGNLTEVQIS